MAKKWFLMMALAAVVAGGAFAQSALSFSAGVNADFLALFKSVKHEGGDPQKTNTVGGGFGAFFDATYAKIGLGLDFANQKAADSKGDGTSLTYFSLSLLGKYPIGLTEKLTLFPLLGFDWNIAMGGESHGIKIKRSDLGEDSMFGEKDRYDAFLIDLGAGVDFALTESLYLRGSFLYGFKTNSKDEREYVDEGAKVFTSGPTLEIGIGYKF
jgi:opacity protein-like surface antigen